MADPISISFFSDRLIFSGKIEMNPGKQQKAFFFDRDGVINTDRGYVFRIEDFEFTDGLFSVMRKLQALGYVLIVITNQSGIGRGYYTETEFLKLTDWMNERLAAEKISIQGVYYCPHSPESDCACRKPAPGMLIQAIREHHLDPSASWLVGDKDSDMQAAEAVGIPNRVILGASRSLHSTHTLSCLTELLELPV